METEHDKENNKTEEGLTVDDAYIESKSSGKPSYGSPNIRFIVAGFKSGVRYPPVNEPHADNSGSEKIPAALPLILGILAVILGFISFYTTYLLSFPGIVFGSTSIIFGVRIKLEKGKLAIAGAMVGIFGLCLSIVKLAVLN